MRWLASRPSLLEQQVTRTYEGRLCAPGFQQQGLTTHTMPAGSTFAGSPLITRAASTVFDVIRQPQFLADVTAKGERLMTGLREQLGSNPHVKEVRGLGLIVGVQLDQVRHQASLT